MITTSTILNNRLYLDSALLLMMDLNGDQGHIFTPLLLLLQWERLLHFFFKIKFRLD